MLTILAAISGSALISSLVWVLCMGLVFWLLLWLLSYLAPPEPFMKIGKALLAIVAVIFLINLIMGIAGHPFITY